MVDNSDFNCYRAISILPCLSKIFEKLVNKQHIYHSETHNVLNQAQSGFITAKLKVLNDIICTIDKHYCVAALLIQLHRLRDTGFSESCLAWFKRYYSSPLESVRSSFSSSSIGSILGPTLISMSIIFYRLQVILIYIFTQMTLLFIHPVPP